MSKAELKTAFMTHDWYHMYSDDPKVWRKGDAELKKLSSLHKSENCPFSLSELRMYAGKMILEDFELLERGYFRIGNKYSCMAPAKREDLITQEKADEITAWFSEA